MKLLSDLKDLRLGCALAAACAVFVSGCQSETVAVELSPPMHARVVDGVTKLPIDGVRVTLISRDAPQLATAYSDQAGFVDMPSLMAPDNSIARRLTDTPWSAVHAIFERPGYETYMIDSVNGYGFFKGHNDVHLYPE